VRINLRSLEELRLGLSETFRGTLCGASKSRGILRVSSPGGYLSVDELKEQFVYDPHRLALSR
jgi:hypothetical protein